KSFPRFFGADVRNHEMTSHRAAGQVRAHVAEFCHRDQVETVKLSGDRSGARARSEIKNFRVEIEEPENVEQTKQRIGHRLQRLVLAQSGKHLPRKHRQQKKKQDGDLEIVRLW